jgi:DNA-directed RNA polymerase specialized sigma24 family protein
VEAGSDICAEVEEYAWANRERLLRMSNPLGYLYRVSQSRSRRYTRWTRRTTFPSQFPDTAHEDPQLHGTLSALAGLSADQRASVLLVHGFGWSYAEVASLLGCSRAAVTNHVHRGLSRLRSVAPGQPPTDPEPHVPHTSETLQ